MLITAREQRISNHATAKEAMAKATSDTAAKAKQTLITAALAVSASGELLKLLSESTSDAAESILQRFAANVQGTGPIALWYLVTKLKLSALWGLESARAAINSSKLSQFRGDVIAYLGRIDEHVKTLQQYAGQEDETWLCGAIFKGLSDTKNISCMSVITTLKRDHKKNPKECGSTRLIAQADECYRDMQAENRYDKFSIADTPSINALAAISKSISKLRDELQQHKNQTKNSKNKTSTEKRTMTRIKG